MSPLIVFCLLIVATSYNVHAQVEYTLEFSGQVLAQCQADNGVDDATVQSFNNYDDVGDVPGAKCMTLCWLSGLGLIADNVPNLEESSKWNNIFFEGEHIDAANEIDQMCIDQLVPAEDECENAYNFMQCFGENAKQQGLVPLGK